MNAAGREIQTLDSEPAQPGNSLVLSLDMDLQEKTTEFLQQAMGDSLNAAAMVMNVHTGEMLAMVSLPGYDDNVFTDISRGAVQGAAGRPQQAAGRPLHLRDLPARQHLQAGDGVGGAPRGGGERGHDYHQLRFYHRQE